MLLAVALLTGCSPPPTSQDFELAGPLTNPEMPLPDGAVATLRSVTSELCTIAVPCVEAWSSDVGVFLRFDTVDDAESYVDAASDAEWDRFVVLDFSDVDIGSTRRSSVTSVILAQLPPEHAPFLF
ncbi:hypothetical protein GCM10009846_08080 [Agrococcus versicolor]|uniref:Lipoprotein n=1 Tax=Agrococcus versicolor TaxID=501482 RepID=A0ABP5MBN7_9MICO